MLLLNSLVACEVTHVIDIFLFFCFPTYSSLQLFLRITSSIMREPPSEGLLQGKTKQVVKQIPWSELERKIICRPKWQFPQGQDERINSSSKKKCNSGRSTDIHWNKTEKMIHQSIFPEKNYKKVLRVEGKSQMEYLNYEIKRWAAYCKYEGVAHAGDLLNP